MSQYSKLKNAELETMLQERGLPYSGKKSDMVARLQSHDSETASKAASTTAVDVPASAVPATLAVPVSASTSIIPEEDKISWDDNDTLPAVSENPSQEVPSTAAPVAESTSTSTQAPVAADSAVATQPAAAAAPPAVALTAEQIDLEIQRRENRAKKFGIELDPESEESKNIERLKRFGGAGGSTAFEQSLASFNTALSDGPRKRGGREGQDKDKNSSRKLANSGGNRPVHAGSSSNRGKNNGGQNRNSGDRGGNDNRRDKDSNGGRRGGRDNANGGRRDGGNGRQNRRARGGESIGAFGTSDADKAAAAARAARFNTT